MKRAIKTLKENGKLSSIESTEKSLQALWISEIDLDVEVKDTTSTN